MTLLGQRPTRHDDICDRHTSHSQTQSLLSLLCGRLKSLTFAHRRRIQYVQYGEQRMKQSMDNEKSERVQIEKEEREESVLMYCEYGMEHAI